MFALVAAFTLIAAPLDQPKELPEAAQKELKKLQGKWKVSSVATSEGVKDQDDLTIEFKDRIVIVQGEEHATVSSLDPATNPKCLDLKSLRDLGAMKKGDVLEAIYKLDGDTLTVAIHIAADKKRPANFDAPKEQGTLLIVFKKMKA